MTEPTAPDPGHLPGRLQGSPDTSAGDDDAFRRRSAALGDGTRLAIYRHIAAREVPVDVAELVETFGLNHNTVRQHLAKLADAALIDRVTEPPRGPGRPRVRYRLTAEAAAQWNAEGPYERLSLLLLQVATTGASPLEVGRAAGRDMAVAFDGVEDPVDAFTAAIAAQGFAPRSQRDPGDRGDDGAELVLENCPFASAAEANAEVVCALHRGLLEGLASTVDGVEFDALDAVDPRQRACRVHLTRSPTSTP